MGEHSTLFLCILFTSMHIEALVHVTGNSFQETRVFVRALFSNAEKQSMPTFVSKEEIGNLSFYDVI